MSVTVPHEAKPTLLTGGAEDAVAVRCSHADRFEAGLSDDHELHFLAHRTLPQPRVEIFLARDLLTVQPHDHVAATDADRAGRSERRDAGHGDTAALTGDRVEPEPRPRTTAHHASLVQELVLVLEELLDGDREVDVRLLSQSERRDPDDTAACVDQRGATERFVVRRHDECPIEHVFPGRREGAYRLDLPRVGDEITVICKADGANEIAHSRLCRLTEGRRRPWPLSLELDHAQPDFEIESNQLRR